MKKPYFLFSKDRSIKFIGYADSMYDAYNTYRPHGNWQLDDYLLSVDELYQIDTRIKEALNNIPLPKALPVK